MFEGLFQPMHLLVIFVIAVLVFGPEKTSGSGEGAWRVRFVNSRKQLAGMKKTPLCLLGQLKNRMK